MDRSKTLLVAEIQFSEGNGSIHAYSDDIPGLHICGTDREAVLRDVVGGIKFLYKQLHGLVIECEWAASPVEVFQHKQNLKGIEHLVMKPAFELAA